MKSLIIIALLVLTGCTTLSSKTYTEYYPFNSNPPENCFISDTNITVINSIPSFEYICNS